MIKLSELYIKLCEDNTPKYKIGQRIKGIGTIEQIYPQKTRGTKWFQYKIDGQYYAETVIDGAIDTKKIEEITYKQIIDLIERLNSNDITKTDIDFGWKLFNFLNTAKGREHFKKYDNAVVSRFNWLQANLNSALSKYS